MSFNYSVMSFAALNRAFEWSIDHQTTVMQLGNQRFGTQRTLSSI